ncbi:sulfite oxidase heme-binding subunit YedZ [Bordetella trematum]|uniref:sulfite oxidase heme-binding subunit YedZ n=1 Tax=Bordetella trematum TaxID=123899 RepID=UPI003D14FD2D
MAHQWSAVQVGRFKPLLFVLGLAAALRWVWLGFNDGLGVNPVEFLTRSSGTWTLVWLLVTLAVTPMRRLLGQPALIRLRRMCGLFAFFYASLHMVAWLWWDRGWDAEAVWRDLLERTFVQVGMAAFVLMAALALTSTSRAMRAMGRRWQQLHRLVYVVGGLAIWHFWLHKAGKNDFRDPILYGLVLAVLLGWRLWAWYGRRRALKAAPASIS